MVFREASTTFARRFNIKIMKPETKNNPEGFAFKKENYMIMLLGIGIIVLGFVLMSLETAPHGFGILALDIAPIVVMTGFLMQFVAIFYEKKIKE